MDLTAIRPGMAVYGADGESLGQVETVEAGHIGVLGQLVPASAVTRVDARGVHLLLARAAFTALHAFATDATDATDATTATAADTAGGEHIVVPLVEERLAVGTREIALGEVIVRKRVVEEEQLVPVIVRREEVTIVRREAGQSWPADAGEVGPGVEVTRIPIRGEEQVVGLRQVVAREVVLERGRVAEERQVTDTVRREHVEVEERYLRERPRLLAQFEAGKAAASDEWTSSRTFEQAEPQYRAGFDAASAPRYQGQDFEAAEPELRQRHAPADDLSGDRWARLRAEIRAGWEAARRER